MRPCFRLAATLACLLTAFAGAPASGAAQSITTYHNGPQRHGAYVMPGLTRTAAANMQLDSDFSGTISGNVYAQPLFWKSSAVPKGEVLVATESDQVVALNPATGATLWTATLGTPVPLSDLPCGNIDPEGVTGTPAIDPATGTLYLDALVSTSSGPRQQIFALNANTGAVLANWPLDVQAALSAQNISFDSTVQGERGGVLFLNGSLYVTYAGRSGDCGDYHGIVLQVDPAQIAIGGYWATRARGGGIWAQGGPFALGADVLVTTGNTFNATTWSDGEAIIRLAPGLAHTGYARDFFTPSNWKALDDSDADLGGTDAVAVTVPEGSTKASRLVALGKDGNAYLVNGGSLGGIGHQIASLPVSSGPIITATAVFEAPNATYVAFRNPADPTCGSAITLLHVTALSMRVAWCAALNGAGAPILTTTDGVHNPIFWVTGAQGDELLHGFDATTGAVVFAGGGSANTMSGLRRFSTILAADGRFYVAGQRRIYAFKYF